MKVAINWIDAPNHFAQSPPAQRRDELRTMLDLTYGEAVAAATFPLKPDGSLTVLTLHTTVTVRGPYGTSEEGVGVVVRAERVGYAKERIETIFGEVEALVRVFITRLPPSASGRVPRRRRPASSPPASASTSLAA